MSNHARQRSPSEPIDVLLVEDNPGDVRLTREAFETTDTETALHVVRDGDAAVERLTRRDGDDPGASPDLALIDLDLPGRDGCEVLEAIRDDPELGRLPVIMFTGSEERDDIAQCYDADANAYLSKPTGADEFTALVAVLEQFWFRQAHLPPVST